MRRLAFVLVAALALAGVGPACYPDEGGADQAGGLSVSLSALEQPLSEQALDSYLSYLRDSAAYTDFDFNIPGNDLFVGLHLIRAVQQDPLVEEEVGFGADAIQIATDPTDGSQSLEMDLTLPECLDCYFTLKLFARAQGPVRTFMGESGVFSLGPDQSPPPLEMSATLVASGLARCVDDAQPPSSVRVSALDTQEPVRFPEVSSVIGAGPPEAVLDLPASGPFNLQFFDPTLSLWQTFALVAFSYENQEIQVHFDHTK